MNKKLSKFYCFCKAVTGFIGISVILSYWSGYLTWNPSDILSAAINPNYNEVNRDEVMGFIHNIITFGLSTGCYLIPFVILTSVFDELSERYQYESWDAMRKSREEVYKKTFKDCGRVVDVDIDEGGTFTSKHVTIKTEEKIYRCLGSVSSVKIGSKVRKQYNDLLVMDGGKEKRLPIA